MKNFFLDIFQNPLFQNIEASSIGKVLAWLLAIGSVGAVCGFMPLWMQSVYFVALALSLGYVLIGGIHFNGKYLTLYIVLVLNVQILPIDPVFNSKMRLLLFTVVTMVVSSALVTKRAVVFRNMVFKNVLILCSILVPISCLCRFLGLNYARMVVSSDMNMQEQVTSTGLFGGLFQHSMMLGPIAAIITIAFFFAYQSYGQKKIYIVLFIMSALACFFSASRGAVLSLVVPILFALFSRKVDQSAKKSAKVIILVACLAILPFAGSVFSGVVEKQQRNVEMGSTFGSRDDKFTFRWNEFLSSPIVGIGFASIDPVGGDIYWPDGTIEPGSSHMAVLSMTGLFGAICYFLIILFAYNCVKNEDDTSAKFKKALLIAMLLHACWEGYVFSGGGFLCLLYWIIVGQAIDYKYLKKYRLLEEKVNSYE